MMSNIRGNFQVSHNILISTNRYKGKQCRTIIQGSIHDLQWMHIVTIQLNIDVNQVHNYNVFFRLKITICITKR